jgi:hypothetical protein
VPWSSSDRKASLPPDWEQRRRACLSAANSRCQARIDDGQGWEWPTPMWIGPDDRCIQTATDVDHRSSRENHNDLQALCSRTTGRRLSANLRLVEPPFVRSCAYPRSARPAYCERYILRSMAEPLNPAERVVPDPEHGWAGADLAEDELVDDGFIATACRRAYKPLQPEDDKLYPPVEGGEA